MKFLLSFLYCYFFLISIKTQAQNYYDKIDDTEFPVSALSRKYGLNFSGLATGSGLGINYNPSFFYRYKKNLFALGPNIQRDNFHFSGLQGFFQRDLAISPESWILYCHAVLLYHISALLGPSGMEQHFNLHGTINSFRYNTLEHYAGFGMKKILTDNIHFDTSIGLGAYYTFNGNQQELKPPFRSDNDLSLMLKLGLTYDLRR
jgi:hypothetical protein